MTRTTVLTIISTTLIVLALFILPDSWINDWLSGIGLGINIALIVLFTRPKVAA